MAIALEMWNGSVCVTVTVGHQPDPGNDRRHPGGHRHRVRDGHRGLGRTDRVGQRDQIDAGPGRGGHDLRVVRRRQDHAGVLLSPGARVPPNPGYLDRQVRRPRFHTRSEHHTRRAAFPGDQNERL